LTHPSVAQQGSVKLGIFHERKVGKTACLQEHITPAEDSMITQRKAEDLDAQIPN